MVAEGPRALLAIHILFIVPLTQEVLHWLPCCFYSSVLESQVFADLLDEASHLGSVLKVNIMNFHIIHRIALWLIWVGVVDEALLLRGWAADLWRVFAGDQEVFVFQLLAVVAEIIIGLLRLISTCHINELLLWILNGRLPLFAETFHWHTFCRAYWFFTIHHILIKSNDLPTIWLAFVVEISHCAASFPSLISYTFLVQQCLSQLIRLCTIWRNLLTSRPSCTSCCCSLSLRWTAALFVLGPTGNITTSLLSCWATSWMDHYVILTTWSKDVISLHIQEVQGLCIYPARWDTSRLVKFYAEDVFEGGVAWALVLVMGLLLRRRIPFLVTPSGCTSFGGWILCIS